MHSSPHHFERAKSQQGRPATRRPSLLGPRAPRHPAYLGDGSDLSGLVDVLGFDGSGPLLSEAVGPPGVVAGTFPCVRGRSAGAAVPGAVPVAALSGAVDVPGLVVWAMALPAPMASSSPAIASFMKELLCCSLGSNLPF